MPRADTQAMSAHLTEIGRAIEPGAHAVVILDRAGWHTSSTLQVPHNITLLPLPPRAPELNPVENVWQFLRDNWLSTASSETTTTSSITAAMPGTNSPNSQLVSPLSEPENGPMSSELRTLVLFNGIDRMDRRQFNTKWNAPLNSEWL